MDLQIGEESIPSSPSRRIAPLCPYFGSCGGCSYQDLPYEEELSLKERELGPLFAEIGLSEEILQPIVPSPSPYHYRSRVDLTVRRSRGQIEVGFVMEGQRRVIAVDSCAIADERISRFIPSLKEWVRERLPPDYRTASLVVKAGGEGRVAWGGIGRRSLELPQSDYLWVEIEGRRVFYSLGTFFQANPLLLAELVKRIRALLSLDKKTDLLDLYAGVGLFWVLLGEEARSVWAVEESREALRLAQWNRRVHGLSKVILVEGKMEETVDEIFNLLRGKRKAGIIDPPREGLSPPALEKLIRAKGLDPLIYCSCHPRNLARDLSAFLQSGWEVDAIVPFDLFPRTRHLEIIARLRNNRA